MPWEDGAGQRLKYGRVRPEQTCNESRLGHVETFPGRPMGGGRASLLIRYDFPLRSRRMDLLKAGSLNT